MKTPIRSGTIAWRRIAPALLLTLACGASNGQAPPTYAIDYHVISAGTQPLSNTCVRLSGTLAEVAPGYSSSPAYALYAGFRAAASTSVDEIFFAGFEAC